MNWPTFAVIALMYAWAAAVFGVTAYAVFWLGHSGWWFLVALIICGGSADLTEKARDRS